MFFHKIQSLFPALSNQFGNKGFQPIKETQYTENIRTGDAVANTLVLFISNLIGFLTVLAGLFFIVRFFLGAFSWINSGGDSGKVEKAREQIFQSVLGLILIVIAYALIGVIGSIVGIDLINLGDTIKQLSPALNTSTTYPTI